jgi:hypothetical protein
VAPRGWMKRCVRCGSRVRSDHGTCACGAYEWEMSVSVVSSTSYRTAKSVGYTFSFRPVPDDSGIFSLRELLGT